jgi:5-methylcytosine-specific restriction endonuclease McrA
MKCSICNSEQVKYKNSKKEFAKDKLLCRKCYNILYKKSIEYIDWKKEYDKTRYLDNSENIKDRTKSYYNSNRAECVLSRREYYNNNKHLFLHYSKLRKHRKAKATPSWLSLEQINEIRDLYLKAKQLTELSGIKYEVNHIIPINGDKYGVCGLHVTWNLQLLTYKENRAKSNRLVEEIV